MKNLFSELFNVSSSLFVLPDYWNLVCDISVDSQLVKIELLIGKIHSQFQTDSIDLYLKFQDAFIKDIIKLKSKYKVPRIIECINYLQMSTFTDSMGYFNVKGLFTYTYDSIILSFNDSKIEIGETIPIEHKRFIDFLYSTNSHIKINSESLLVTWFSHLYYYSYSFGGLINFGIDFWDYAIELSLKSKSFDNEKMQLLSNLMTWSNIYKPNDRLVITSFLIEENKKINLNHDLKRDIRRQLILIKDLDKKYRLDLFEQLTNEHELKGHFELQLVVALIDDINDFDLRYNQIMRAIIKYNDYIKCMISNPILLTYEKSRIFKVIEKLIILLIKESKTNQLIKILGKYYDVVDELETSMLFIVPYSDKGVFYCCNEEMILHEDDSFKRSKELLDLSNMLFNKTISLIGDEEDIPAPKRLMGVPSKEFSTAYEIKALELYNFNTIKEKFSKNINGMISSGFKSVPIQYLMLKKIGFTYPISISLSKSLKEAKIESLLIVANGTLTSNLELEALKYICEKYNIYYEVMTESKIYKEEFIKLYNSEKFSVIWIATHGEHNNYEPQKSTINLSEKVSISLEELTTLELSNKTNRLLVLNLCESGVNSELSGFKCVGFSHQLASKYQSIISHLWMVEPKMAMAFGMLLAIGLISGRKKFFDAYCEAVLTLLNGKEYTLNALRKELNELNVVLERIENLDEDNWKNMLNIGSAAFFN